MKKRVICSLCIIVTVILIFSGCAINSPKKTPVTITADNFTEYFNISASFDNLSTTSRTSFGMTQYSGSCNAILKCTAKSNFDIDSAEVSFTYEIFDWITDTHKATIYINNNSSGETTQRISTKVPSFFELQLPSNISGINITSASGTIYV